MAAFSFYERPQQQQRLERLWILFQATAWCIYITLPFLLLTVPGSIPITDIVKIFGLKIINDLLSIAFFYTNLYVLTPDILVNQRLMRFGLALVGLMGLMLVTDWLYANNYLLNELSMLSRHNQFARSLLAQTDAWFAIPTPILLVSFLSLLLLTSVSSGLAIYNDRNQYKATGQQMVIEKQEAELTSLKLQISPHFLFNTLNNLRWLARQKSDDTEDAILRLSDMMRYMIYQVDNGPVTLAREIDYLQHYVELQAMRLTANNQLTFVVETTDRNVLIEPLLFIHLVENAFKHGVHPEEESPVTIRLTFQNDLLTFETRNRILTNELSSTDSGIGIQNVERRLALHYPDQHELRIYSQNGLFCVDLTIHFPA
ncbi:sensor histidine kinase [Spirosoma sordidisoli]|uniref:Sensor histidine kinase n=1 Tax=Spirosoma sordidisoli TaxID=2502893 RepID=A0A4Q2UR22_9BACT|nr:sensor histidine kinase [Spirosoma sordidisoli]RYC70100.1 sensor histidine kinase [Spirosoma sordidisoli]